MKKLLLGLIIFLIAPFMVYAKEDEVLQYYVDAEIDIAGSMNVKEIFVLEGPFNGVFRGVNYGNPNLNKWTPGNIDFENSAIYNGGSITNLVIKAKYVKNDIDFDTFDESDFDEFKSANYASNGQKALYTTTGIPLGEKYAMYYPASSNQKVAFYLSYTITNVVVMHNDVAEVYWQFVGEDFTYDVKDLFIRIRLPYADTSDDFRFWAHGNLEGEIAPLVNSDNQNIGIQAYIKNLPSYGDVDVRMIFNKDIIPISGFINNSETNAKEEILKVEEKRADDANRQRNAIKGKYYTALFGCVAYIIILIAIWIYIYIKFDKEHQSNFKAKYFREFIDEYSVEVIDYLNHRNITPNAMSSSIMNLIYKKNITVEEIPTKKKKKDYTFTLINKDGMSDNELYLTEFLFERVGSENTFTTIDLQKYASGNNTYSKFTSSYETWKNKVVKEGRKQEFFENNFKIKLIGVVYALIGVGIFFMGLSVGIEASWLPLVIVLAVIFLVYTLIFSKRTLKGNDHYLKWKAFKNFLNDFSILDQRELPEIILWERYMVYAVILGVADKVQKAMNVRIQEIDPAMTTYTYSPVFNMYMHMNLSKAINNSIQTAVRESISKAVANSAASSGSGHGGGFSSGGGFGGGGGGSIGKF